MHGFGAYDSPTISRSTLDLDLQVPSGSTWDIFPQNRWLETEVPWSLDLYWHILTPRTYRLLVRRHCWTPWKAPKLRSPGRDCKLVTKPSGWFHSSFSIPWLPLNVFSHKHTDTVTSGTTVVSPGRASGEFINNPEVCWIAFFTCLHG